eukprot:3728870-Alexandrium_andersonii.AAC.1
MSASLVGSEMCIRDRKAACLQTATGASAQWRGAPLGPTGRRGPDLADSVSYTHLTLPTICSV